MINYDEESFYREFTLKSKNFVDFEDDQEDDFVMLFGNFLQKNISHEIHYGGINWKNEWYISIDTNKIEELTTLSEFIEYINENNQLGNLVSHYINFKRISFCTKLNDIYADYQLIKQTKLNYQELSREIPQYIHQSNLIIKKTKI